MSDFYFPVSPLFLGRLFEGASAGAMFMQGAGGHMVWVDPALQAVVVTRWLDPAHHAGFIAMAAGALRGTFRHG